jgi:predicted DNA-binding transcriptional regulator AlpA
MSNYWENRVTQIPPGFITLPEFQRRIVRLDRRTLLKMELAGTFPRRVYLGPHGVIAWRWKDIRRWTAGLSTERMPLPIFLQKDGTPKPALRVRYGVKKTA